MSVPSSARLVYVRLARAQLDAFHALVQDEHVRQYLMDGETFPREWSADRVADSDALFDDRGVGLWLVSEAPSQEIIGFCGFLVFSSLSPDPQLVYALRERFTGHGYATEMAGAAIHFARSSGALTDIVAGVDEVNARSIRVLEKLGFTRTGTAPGAFGLTLMYRLQS